MSFMACEKPIFVIAVGLPRKSFSNQDTGKKTKDVEGINVQSNIYALSGLIFVMIPLRITSFVLELRNEFLIRNFEWIHFRKQARNYILVFNFFQC